VELITGPPHPGEQFVDPAAGGELRIAVPVDRAAADEPTGPGLHHGQAVVQQRVWRVRSGVRLRISQLVAELGHDPRHAVQRAVGEIQVVVAT